MAITAEQREQRRKYIGSSDAAAILGLDPFKVASDVWLEKTGQLVPDDAGNEHTQRGTFLEPALLGWAEAQLGVRLRRDLMVRPADGSPLVANLDGFVDGPTDGSGNAAIVEAKTTVNADEWGQPGTDEVPHRVLVQVHHQFAVVGPACRRAHVVMLAPGYRSFDFRLYHVDRNDQVAAAVAKAGVEFMERYVRTRTRPDDYRPSIDVLKRVRREPGKVITLPDALVADWQGKCVAKKAAEDAEKAARALVLAALGDAEAGTCGTGRLTYMETKRSGYAVEPVTFRQLRFTAAKKGK
ncbi:MAG TPA: YqaJ viral recombinase family protein [Tepidisphaeraceae bacterium]|nr:YqaJ viral recombinase family protein [Tepidisphaeraceae bacterium]